MGFLKKVFSRRKNKKNKKRLKEKEQRKNAGGFLEDHQHASNSRSGSYDDDYHHQSPYHGGGSNGNDAMIRKPSFNSGNKPTDYSSFRMADGGIVTRQDGPAGNGRYSDSAPTSTSSGSLSRKSGTSKSQKSSRKSNNMKQSKSNSNSNDSSYGSSYDSREDDYYGRPRIPNNVSPTYEENAFQADFSGFNDQQGRGNFNGHGHPQTQMQQRQGNGSALNYNQIQEFERQSANQKHSIDSYGKQQQQPQYGQQQ